MKSNNKVYVIGSGDSLNKLTGEEKRLINQGVVVSFNKYFMFCDKIGLIPDHHVMLDWNQMMFEGTIEIITSPWYQQILKEYNKCNFILSEGAIKKYNKIYSQFSPWGYGLDFQPISNLRVRHGRYSQPIYNHSEDRHVVDILRINQTFRDIKIKDRNAMINKFNGYCLLCGHALAGDDRNDSWWSKNMKDVFQMPYNTLFTTLNVVNVLYPKADVLLVGCDYSDRKYFFERYKNSGYVNKHTRRIVRSEHYINMLLSSDKSYRDIAKRNQHTNVTGQSVNLMHGVVVRVEESGGNIYCESEDSLLCRWEFMEAKRIKDFAGDGNKSTSKKQIGKVKLRKDRVVL